MIYLTLLNINPVFAAQTSNSDIIIGISTEIKNESDLQKLAKLYCFRARQYAKQKDSANAESDYLTALGHDMVGWILNEFGYFLYHDGQYEKAYKVAIKTNSDFPQLSKDSNKLKSLAKAKYQEEYYKKNPPTIVIDTVPNYNRKTRFDVKREQQQKVAAQQSQNVISSQCKEKWGTDYSMVEYCIKKQQGARSSVSRYSSGTIKRQCREKWGTDYSMIEYCIKKQSGAKRSVSRHSQGTIKTQCEQKWGTDYSMVEYCIKKQSAAKRSIDRM